MRPNARKTRARLPRWNARSAASRGSRRNAMQCANTRCRKHTMTRVPSLNPASINSLPPNMRQAFLTNLSEGEADFLTRDWRFWARRSQLPPDGDWRIWLFMGGRGSGKTRAGAEWIAEGVARGLYARVALIGATHNDARQVMIEGES